ncbi:MAG: hypothetical protein A2W23_08260 [Planctomycetes bacterium RBG_16_43_13]|nr:MAG: hypothetical protein A2W23_08260 [Planctomycetes bacterium RBG_16_43_13]
MDDERQKILKMLAEKKISVEEASKLLNTLKGEDVTIAKPPPSPQNTQTPPAKERSGCLFWVIVFLLLLLAFPLTCFYRYRGEKKVMMDSAKVITDSAFEERERVLKGMEEKWTVPPPAAPPLQKEDY